MRADRGTDRRGDAGTRGRGDVNCDLETDPVVVLPADAETRRPDILSRCLRVAVSPRRFFTGVRAASSLDAGISQGANFELLSARQSQILTARADHTRRTD